MYALYQIRKTFVLLAYLFVDAVCKAHDGTGCRAVFLLGDLQAFRAAAVSAVVSLSNINLKKIPSDDGAGSKSVCRCTVLMLSFTL